MDRPDYDKPHRRHQLPTGLPDQAERPGRPPDPTADLDGRGRDRRPDPADDRRDRVRHDVARPRPPAPRRRPRRRRTRACSSSFLIGSTGERCARGGGRGRVPGRARRPVVEEVPQPVVGPKSRDQAAQAAAAVAATFGSNPARARVVHPALNRFDYLGRGDRHRAKISMVEAGLLDLSRRGGPLGPPLPDEAQQAAGGRNRRATPPPARHRPVDWSARPERCPSCDSRVNTCGGSRTCRGGSPTIWPKAAIPAATLDGRRGL